MDIPQYCQDLANQAAVSAGLLNKTSAGQRDSALKRIAQNIRVNSAALIEQNKLDLAAGQKNNLSAALLDRLELTPQRVEKIAASVEQIADQPSPVGQIIEGRVLSNGIRLEKMRVPIGVILIIFESRPNVTCDAAALCIKSGNSVILRGGKEAKHTNSAIADCVQKGLSENGIDPNTAQLVATTDRSAVGELLGMAGQIDLCIPRGGKSLIHAVVDQAKIPVIKHYTGNCHVYVDSGANPKQAIDICVNAKAQRPGVCNAAETILFHKDNAKSGALKDVLTALYEKGVEIRADKKTLDCCKDVSPLNNSLKPLAEEDWAQEFLELTVAVGVVDSLDNAIAHINKYGSKHTDAIVTQSVTSAEKFIAQVDSANVFVNCSTRFSDGGQYGLGAEIGISTDKLHARGPMGAGDLTTYKWVARGDGQIRE